MLPCIAPSSTLLAARRVSARRPLNNDLPTHPDHHARLATDSGSSCRSTIWGVANTALTWNTAASQRTGPPVWRPCCHGLPPPDENRAAMRFFCCPRARLSRHIPPLIAEMVVKMVVSEQLNGLLARRRHRTRWAVAGLAAGCGLRHRCCRDGRSGSTCCSPAQRPRGGVCPPGCSAARPDDGPIPHQYIPVCLHGMSGCGMCVCGISDRRTVPASPSPLDHCATFVLVSLS